MVAKAEAPPPSSSPLEFEFTYDAAATNSSLLEEVGYDLGAFIDKHPGSTISYGSELRPLSQIEPLLQHHPSYEHFKRNMLEGIDYPLEEISDEARRVILDKSIAPRNHKSALKEEERPHVSKLMTEDVELGYGIPLTVDCIRNLPGAEVYPIGVQNQLTINEKGEVIPKKRVTHNLSFNRKDGTSVNQRVREEEMPEVIYGHTMHRFLHLIHHLRWNHPHERILCNKIDIEKAYRRLHTKASVAVKCVAIWCLDSMWKNPQHQQNDEIAVLLTRLPFGSSPAPGEFSETSETMFDLANDLLYCS